MTSGNLSVPLLDLKGQFAAIREEVYDALRPLIESQMFILGPEVEALEREVAAYCHCRFGVGVSSGTDALLVSLMARGLKPGDEVITTPYTFFATAGSIARLGATPVLVDIDPVSFNMDVGAIEPVISPRTKALIPVHLYGQAAEMDRIMDLAGERQLLVVEDAAQAIGAEYRGRRIGSLGHCACLSFFPSKNLGGFGDGGMVTTNDQELADRLKCLRNHGFERRYYNVMVGGNFRLDALQAAVLRVKLRYLDDWTAARQRNAAEYARLFREAGLVREEAAAPALDREGGVILPRDLGLGRHVYNQFVIRAGRRDALKAYLGERQIGAEIYYPVPLHLQECFAYLGYRPGDFPESERAAAQTLALPIFPELTAAQLEYVVAAVRGFYQG